MSIKQHQELCQSFDEKFPSFFNFQKCGLLLIDASDNSLYKIIDAKVPDDEKSLLRRPTLKHLEPE